jgi:uncharacterized membrane protein YadS
MLMSKRRWNKSFFLNMTVALLLGGISFLVDQWTGLLIAVAGYICGGVVILAAAAETRAHEIQDQRARREEFLHNLYDGWPG